MQTRGAESRLHSGIDSTVQELRTENRETHRQIGENIAVTRDELSGRVGFVESSLSARIDTIDRRDRRRALAAVAALED